jgi:hypothetical protein
MRFLLLFLLGACAPEIVSGAYLCGPDSSCPEDLACNGIDNTCVLASLVEPFACEPQVELEPDNTAAEGYLIENLECVSAPFVNENCMLEADSADWVKFVAPSACTAVEVEARLAFPVAFEELAVELWNLDQDMKIAESGPCTQGVDTGEERRCLDFTLVPGTSYGIKVHPTGEGDCDGTCAYNRYTLRVQLATPG